MASSKQPVKISHTRMTTFNRCRQRYYYQYISFEPRKETPLKWVAGKAGHIALEHVYKGGDRDKAIELAYRHMDPEGVKEKESLWQTLVVVLNRYFDEVFPNDNWKVLATEQQILWKTGNKVYQGIVDLVVEDKDSLRRMIVDHKFSESVHTNHLDTDQQATLYLAILAGRQKNIDGMLFNYIRMHETGKAEEEPVKRIWQERSRKQLEASLIDFGGIVRDIRRMHAGQAEVYRNWMPNCAWDCPFRTKCVLDWESGK